MSVDKQLKTFHEMLEKMNPSERELFSDKLLSYLLFNPEDALTQKRKPSEKNKNLKKSDLTPEELKLIKELAKRTEELRNLLGDEPDFFS